MGATRIVDGRRGFSLIELLLVIGMLAAAVGILLPAVIKARGAALKSRSASNIKQLLTAAHNFSQSNRGFFPTIFGNKYGTEEDAAIFVVLLPYLEGQKTQQELVAEGNEKSAVRLYLDPADPSALLAPPPIRSSYAANAYALRERRSLASGFPDGTSNTIGIGCHYSRCKKVDYNIVLGSMAGMGFHRATFADSDDVTPWVKPTGTTASFPGKSFQITPSTAECDPDVPQSCYSGGMLVGNVDGSVKTLSSDTSSEHFWSLVTPNGNESASE